MVSATDGPDAPRGNRCRALERAAGEVEALRRDCAVEGHLARGNAHGSVTGAVRAVVESMVGPDLDQAIRTRVEDAGVGAAAVQWGPTAGLDVDRPGVVKDDASVDARLAGGAGLAQDPGVIERARAQRTADVGVCLHSELAVVVQLGVTVDVQVAGVRPFRDAVVGQCAAIQVLVIGTRDEQRTVRVDRRRARVPHRTPGPRHGGAVLDRPASGPVEPADCQLRDRRSGDIGVDFECAPAHLDQPSAAEADRVRADGERVGTEHELPAGLDVEVGGAGCVTAAVDL